MRQNSILLAFLFTCLSLTLFGQHSRIAAPVTKGNKSSEIARQTLAPASLQDNTAVPSKRNCGTTEYMEDMLQQNPAWKARLDQLELETQELESNPAAHKTQAVITIPVVVHVVYRTTSENISDAQILSQIAILNDDFRKLNADTTNIPSVFKPLAVDAQIEFCMAVQDPSGNPTNGITRTQTTVSSFSTNNSVKSSSTGGKSAWPANKYLNIWVCNMGGGILGYAQFPGGSATTDGVVVGHKYFGNIGTAQAPYNKGRTATHEVGHWLNLRHTWGDANCGNDFVSDTPTSQAANYSCPSFPNVTCSNGPDGDMFMNYMDYVDDNCMHMFTPGQSTRMLAALNNQRSGLLTSDGCTPLNAPPAADFVANTQIVLAGGTVNFTDLSLYTPTSWSWTFTGGNPASSTLQNPAGIVYSTPGVYPVTLTATNGNGADTETKTAYINVVNPGGAGACDTLNYPLDSIVVYTVPNNGGFVTGTNQFGDEAKAVFIANPGAATHITGVMIEFGAASAASTSSSVLFNIWDNSGPGGSPGTIIGSQSVLITDIITNGNAGQPTTAAFSNPVPITGPFYAGFTIPLVAGDTVAVVSDTIGHTVPGLAWESYNGAWYNLNDQTNSFGIDLNLGIYPLTTNTPPTASFTVANGNVCVGDTVNLTGTSANAQVHSWSFPNGTPTSGTGITQQVSYLNAGTYNVTLTAVGSCLASSTVTQNGIIVVSGTPAVTVSPSTISICPGNTTNLTATGATSYSWSPSTGLSATTGASVAANPGTTQVYTVTGSNTAGCTNTATVNLTVVTNLVPTAIFTATPVSGCPGVTINLNNTSQDALSYSWSTPGGSPTTSTQSDPVVTYPNTGSFPITLIATGCNGNDTLTFTNMITITAPIILVNPPADTINPGGNTTLTAIGGTSYSWFPSTGLNTTSGASVIASPTVTTTYTVTATDNQGCQTSVDVVVTVDAVSRAADWSQSTWNIFPSPTTDFLQVQNELNTEASVEFVILDVSGRILETHSFEGSQFNLKVGHLSPGVYLTEVKNSETVLLRRKIIISR